MSTGKIGVSTGNLFPIIKKFLYSDHEIFFERDCFECGGCFTENESVGFERGV